jgi:hypothetical protein
MLKSYVLVGKTREQQEASIAQGGYGPPTHPPIEDQLDALLAGRDEDSIVAISHSGLGDYGVEASVLDRDSSRFAVEPTPGPPLPPPTSEPPKAAPSAGTPLDLGPQTDRRTPENGLGKPT